MIVAVTGATGHIGGNLVRSLNARGIRPRVLVHKRNPDALAGLDVEEHRGDVADLGSLVRFFDGAERVYHLAAIISLDDAQRDHMRATNIGGVKNVVTAARTTGVKRLVHFSSIHALSTQPHEGEVDETRPLVTNEPVPPYDRSKADGERALREGIAAGLDAVIVNPTGVIGPNDFGPSHMGEVMLDLYYGRLPALVDGGFNWVDVRDVAEAAIAAGDKGKTGERYLLAGHRQHIGYIAGIVKEQGGTPPRFAAPMWLARVGAPFAVGYARLLGKRPLFNAASLHALRHHHVVSHAKAERELGFVPRPTRESVLDALASFRERKLI